VPAAFSGQTVHQMSVRESEGGRTTRAVTQQQDDRRLVGSECGTQGSVREKTLQADGEEGNDGVSDVTVAAT